MERLLLDEGLVPKETKRAISFAKAKRIVQSCYPYIDEIRGDLWYGLEEDNKEADKELEEDSRRKGDHRNLEREYW